MGSQERYYRKPVKYLIGNIQVNFNVSSDMQLIELILANANKLFKRHLFLLINYK